MYELIVAFCQENAITGSTYLYITDSTGKERAFIPGDLMQIKRKGYSNRIMKACEGAQGYEICVEA